MKRIAFIFVGFALSLTSLSSIAAQTTPTTPSAKPTVSSDKRIWNLKDVDIRSVILQVAQETGKNFILDPRVKGKVTLISHTPLSTDELYQAFLTLLQVHGYSVVTSGGVIKIIPSTDAKTSATRVIDNNKLISDENVVRVIHVDYVPVKNLLTTLKPLVARDSYISAYDPTNDLIVADSAANVRRILEIVDRLDKPTETGTEIIRLHHGYAPDIVKTLNELSKTTRRTTASSPEDDVNIAADERTNSVLISGGKNQRLHLRALVSELDIEGESGYNTQVIFLKYMRAADMAPIIANIIGAYEAEQSSGTSRQSNQTQPFTTNNQTSGSSAQRPPLSLTTPSASAGRSSLLGRFNQSSNFELPDENRAKSGVVGPGVQWEESTNSIIVKAPPGLLSTISRIIKKLDVRRPQVLVEAIVAEVDENRFREFGIELNTGGSIPLRTSFPSTTGSNITAGNLASIGNDGIVDIGSGLTLGFINAGNLRAIVRALAGDSTSNIMATPNIVTLDNETASIKVGQLVPFSTGVNNNEVVGGTPTTFFDREEVGLSLTIRPQITKSGSVKLYIQNIISAIVPGSQNNNAGNNPTTTERVISTNVLVDNQQVLVLGGLIQKQMNNSVGKVPILGDLPLIGAAFRSKDRSHDKTNLMIFIKPTILRNNFDNREVTDARYDHMRGRQLDAVKNTNRPYVRETYALPPIDQRQEEILPPPFPIFVTEQEFVK